MTETPLPGNATSGVVRVGDTVRRPAGAWTDTVDALLRHLRDVGFTGAPRPLGRDELGRQVLEFLPGEVGDARPHWSAEYLHGIGSMLSAFHEAASTFTPSRGAQWQQAVHADRLDQVVHNDPAPWNLVRRPGNRWALIDWDFAGPGSRLWDISYTAQTAVPLRADRDHELDVLLVGLRSLVDGYGLSEDGRRALAPLITIRTRAMVQLLCEGAASATAPWDRIWVEDGPYWRSTAEYLAEREEVWLHAMLR